MDIRRILCNLPRFHGRFCSRGGRRGNYAVSSTWQDDNFFPPKRRKRRSIMQVTDYRRPLFKKHTFSVDTSGIDLAQLQ